MEVNIQNKIVWLALTLLPLSVNASDNTENQKITTKEALEFATYIDSKPTNIILFETTTREINFNKKTALITDVAKLNSNGVFKPENYAETKPFTMDFSKIILDLDLNKDTYPQKRIQDKCNLKTEEYGLFVEGKFEESGIFIVSGLKPKLLDSNNIFYCYGGVDDYSSKKKEEKKEIKRIKYVKKEQKANLF
jgi:hypothetical protein